MAADKTKCSICNRSFEYKRSKGHRKYACNSCLVTKRRKERNQKIYEYKGDICERCGYNGSKKALCFHHVDPTQKEFRIANSWGKSWERVKKELDKCILLCSNCHAEEHDSEYTPE